MSRSCPLWLIAAILALCGALLAGCGGTPAAVPVLSPSPVPPSATASPAPPTSLPATEIPTGAPSPTGTPAATPTGHPSPTATPTERASDTPHPTETPPPPSATPPPPTERPTETPRPSTATPAPQILSFTAVPTITQNLGDAVHLAWEARGRRAELCPLLATGPTGCREVPLSGAQDFVVDEPALSYAGFALRVHADGTWTLATVELHPQCRNLRPWFFANPPLRCPEAEALTSFAAAQPFERGLMVWVEETDEFYVFYDEPDALGFQVVERTAGLHLKPGASADNRVGEDPPPGLYEPVSGFGLVWRGEVEWPYGDGVRERLGWATAPEFGYDTAYQCATPAHPRLWDCFLLGPDGEVILLRPDSTAGVRTLWAVW